MRFTINNETYNSDDIFAVRKNGEKSLIVKNYTYTDFVLNFETNEERDYVLKQFSSYLLKSDMSGIERVFHHVVNDAKLLPTDLVKDIIIESTEELYNKVLSKTKTKFKQNAKHAISEFEVMLDALKSTDVQTKILDTLKDKSNDIFTKVKTTKKKKPAANVESTESTENDKVLSADEIKTLVDAKIEQHSKTEDIEAMFEVLRGLFGEEAITSAKEEFREVIMLELTRTDAKTEQEIIKIINAHFE